MKPALLKRNRDASLDCLRGIGIILVIVGHFFHNEIIRIFIYSFHMPLFFILSGYLFRFRSGVSIVKYIKDRAAALLIPYLSMALINMVCSLVLNKGTGFQSNLLAIFFWVISDNFPIGGALWYLVALFIMDIVAQLLFTTKNNVLIVVTCIVFLGCVNATFDLIRLPYCLTAVMICFPFFFFGVVSRKLDGVTSIKGLKGRKMLIVVGGCLIGTGMAFLNGEGTLGVASSGVYL